MRAPALALALLAAGCGAPAPPPARPPAAERVYPGVLRPPASFPGDFLLRQHVVATYGARSIAFDAVVQKHGDALTYLALTPFGSRAFMVRQTGTEVAFERWVDRDLPFPPRYILIDLHRVLLAGVAEDGGALPDGAHAVTRGEESIRERWEGGRLVERAFRRTSGDPAGEIVIAYDGGMIPGRSPPRRMVLENGWFGYRIELTVVSWEPL